MRIHLIIFFTFCLLIGLYCTNRNDGYPSGSVSHSFFTDSIKVTNYLEKGDSIYALKEGFNTFEKAAEYFDSALALATQINDTALLGSAYFSKASIYNAWNGQPEKTIEYFQKAADLMAPNKRLRFGYFYSMYLLAHAYDYEKAGDSAKCVEILNIVYDSLSKRKDTFRKKLVFIPDLAWVATNVENYTLAEKILNDLTNRQNIINDPKTNNYLDHYYLSKSRIAIFHDKDYNSPYLDSLELAVTYSKNSFDSNYFAANLFQMMGTAGKFEKAYYYGKIAHISKNKRKFKKDNASLENKLLNLELQNEIRKQEMEVSTAKARLRLLWVMGFALALISLLSIRNYIAHKKYKKQSKQLETTNQQLDEKVNEVQLLNKEMQHRIKNNLHMIFSLLQMQERQSNNEDTAENLQAARLRIESIALLHDHLTSNENEIDFNAYTAKLVNNLLTCFDSDQKVVTHLSMLPISMPVNQNFPISLILNEWITNSIKYAKKPNGMLEIYINLKRTNGNLVLEYFDNGIVSTDNTIQKTGLGTQIINLLAKQLKGKLDTMEQNPFHYQLSFPYEG